MEKVLITGVNGLLGQKCVAHLISDYQISGIDVHDEFYLQNKQVDYIKIDITKRDDLKNALLYLKPHYIVNTAAYTNVDGSETHKELCWKINVEGVQNLTYGASKIKAKMIHISSDYVFDGKKGPYKENDIPNALGYYGKSKLASENVLHQSDIEYAIIRTMILYGAGINIRPNFATWFIDKLKNGEKVSIVTDQYGSPTLADELARAIKKIIDFEKWDTYHVSGKEIMDRYSFALKIANAFDLDKDLISPITTANLKQAALRPMHSGFILDKIRKNLAFEVLSVDECLKIFKKQLKKIKFI